MKHNARMSVEINPNAILSNAIKQNPVLSKNQNARKPNVLNSNAVKQNALKPNTKKQNALIPKTYEGISLSEFPNHPLMKHLPPDIYKRHFQFGNLPKVPSYLPRIIDLQNGKEPLDLHLLALMHAAPDGPITVQSTPPQLLSDFRSDHIDLSEDQLQNLVVNLNQPEIRHVREEPGIQYIGSKTTESFDQQLKGQYQISNDLKSEYSKTLDQINNVKNKLNDFFVKTRHIRNDGHPRQLGIY